MAFATLAIQKVLLTGLSPLRFNQIISFRLILGDSPTEFLETSKN